MHQRKIAGAKRACIAAGTSIRVHAAICSILVATVLGPRAAVAQMPHERPHRSLTLQQLIRDVITGNPAVLATAARVRAAQGARSTAGAFQNPMLSYQIDNAPLPGRPAPVMDREAMTMATLALQPLYTRWPRVRLASAELEAAESSAYSDRQRIVLDAARAFYDTALAQVELQAATDLNAWMDSVVAYNRSRADEGAIAELDLIRSQLERDRVAAEHSMHAADLARSSAALAAFLTDTSTVRAAFDTVPLRGPKSDGPPQAGALAGALAHRPDIRAARARVNAAGAAVALQRTMIIGDLDATFGIKRSSGTSSLIVGVSAPLPLLTQNRGEIKRTSAERDVAGYELVRLEREARADIIGNSETEHLLTLRTTELSSGFLRRADEARDITLAAYREGGVSLLQVIDAARAWSEARSTFFHLLFAQHLSVLQRLASEGVDLSAVDLGSAR
jgi:cobalt-zinc-cadmium efflux system outer membrane protein